MKVLQKIAILWYNNVRIRKGEEVYMEKSKQIEYIINSVSRGGMTQEEADALLKAIEAEKEQKAE